jgi:uncharacterized membrane protein
MRSIMAALYFAAGLVHVAAPEKFLPIAPDWVPFPREVVFVTGLCEIAGGLALVGVHLRRYAGLMLALYAIGVFPANIKHATEEVHVSSLPDSWGRHGPRLRVQPVLVWWALLCSGVVDWPFETGPIGCNRCPRGGYALRQ